MKTLQKSGLLLLSLFVLVIIHPFQKIIPQQELLSPTPTYDPLVEPPLPENPTEIELGRNLYWHWCMTCHGDKGQGLTDEFRRIWVPDHQDCWGRGCHAGHPGDMGFPIPTIVPALVNDSQLARFISVQQLSDYLKATHPPQSPGILGEEEYHAIAVFVFTMNERSLINLGVTRTPGNTDAPVPTLISTQTLIPSQKSESSAFPLYAAATFAMLVVGLFAWVRRSSSHGRKS